VVDPLVGQLEKQRAPAALPHLENCWNTARNSTRKTKSPRNRTGVLLLDVKNPGRYVASMLVSIHSVLIWFLQSINGLQYHLQMFVYSLVF